MEKKFQLKSPTKTYTLRCFDFELDDYADEYSRTVKREAQNSKSIANFVSTIANDDRKCIQSKHMHQTDHNDRK